jgi:SNF2 family DNA or RNA helicase
VSPFILRRLKKDVLKELPPKIESVLTAELTVEQKRVYLAYLEQIRGRIEEEIRDKGFEKSRIQILAGLTRLRQICCHPSLFIENYNGESGKMELLLELLEELKEGGHRVLLFSQFTGALKLIKGHLEMRNISYFYLDGSTKADCRTDMVKAFNQGLRDTFLISLKAGGTGLNLTGADTVIHFDLWWNPAVEEQATDRAHRIGQQSAVQVMKLITRGTIEEKIFKLQQKKRELINSVLQPGETFISRMTEEDIRDLFRIS